MAGDVTLRVVDAGNQSAVERLQVATDQEGFVDGVAASSRSFGIASSIVPARVSHSRDR
jgi:hypothetical protein